MEETKKEGRVILGFILAVIVFVVLAKVVPFLTAILVVLMGIGWSDELIKDVLALGNIIGVVGGAWAGYKTYKYFARRK